MAIRVFEICRRMLAAGLQVPVENSSGSSSGRLPRTLLQCSKADPHLCSSVEIEIYYTADATRRLCFVRAAVEARSYCMCVYAAYHA